MTKWPNFVIIKSYREDHHHLELKSRHNWSKGGTPIPRYRPPRYRSFSLPSLKFFALKDTRYRPYFRYRPFFMTKTFQKYRFEANMTDKFKNWIDSMEPYVEWCTPSWFSEIKPPKKMLIFTSMKRFFRNSSFWRAQMA